MTVGNGCFFILIENELERKEMKRKEKKQKTLILFEFDNKNQTQISINQIIFNLFQIQTQNPALFF